ncbi:unnamed protein product, partial [Prorocentrum cordatum]
MCGAGEPLGRRGEPAGSRFLLSRGRAAAAVFELNRGEKATIGRAFHSDVVIKSKQISGHHVELFFPLEASQPSLLLARDVSTNGTGFRLAHDAEFVALDRGRAQLLPHGAELLLPLRVPGAAKAEADAAQVRLTVRYLHAVEGPCMAPPPDRRLPDAWMGPGSAGRWRYSECLGEGGLGFVYLVYDMVGDLGAVALKVSKWGHKSHGLGAPRESWEVYTMHREAQWSQQCLHNQDDPRYDAKLASLFVRYLEDHTGFPPPADPAEFHAVRAAYEQPGLDWRQDPYVVMELALGEVLSSAKPEETFSAEERCAVTHQAAEALVYLGRFGLLHRDFRTANIHVARRGGRCRIKVLDLGLLIRADPGAATSTNVAVKALWDRRQREYDWVPPEVFGRPPRNFALPAHSFDVYSLAVLIMRLHGGKSWARKVLQGRAAHDDRLRQRLREKGLDADQLAE